MMACPVSRDTTYVRKSQDQSSNSCCGLITFEKSSSKELSAAEIWLARRRSHFGEEKRWAMMNEHRSRNLEGTTVGS